MMNSVEIANWMSDDEWMFEPRLRDRVQHVSRIRMVVERAPEEDAEHDCE